MDQLDDRAGIRDDRQYQCDDTPAIEVLKDRRRGIGEVRWNRELGVKIVRLFVGEQRPDGNDDELHDADEENRAAGSSQSM